MTERRLLWRVLLGVVLAALITVIIGGYVFNWKWTGFSLQFLHESHLIEGAKPIVDLHGADLSHAYVWGADLREADSSGVNLAGATLAGANLSSARLIGAIITPEQLAAARSLHGTILPDGSMRG